MSTEHTHTFEVGDLARNYLGRVAPVVDVREDTAGRQVRVTAGDEGPGAWLPGQWFEPVVASAEHVGSRARITDQDSAEEYRGRRGVVVSAANIEGGFYLFDDKGDPWTPDPGCAILVADEPTPAAEPDTSTLRGRVEVAVWGTVHVASEAAAAVDAVMDVVGPDPAAGLTVTPDGQRVVDAKGVPVAYVGDRDAAALRADAEDHDEAAHAGARIAAVLRLLADHAEAAEATPTVYETLAALDVVKAASTGDATQSDYDAAMPVLSRYLAAAARTARTGDGA